MSIIDVFISINDFFAINWITVITLLFTGATAFFIIMYWYETKNLVKISKEEYKSNIQIVFNNDYLQETQNNRILKIFNSKFIKIVSNCTNISLSTTRFNILYNDSITYSRNGKPVTVNSNDGERISKACVLKPKEFLIIEFDLYISDSVYNCLDDICSINQGRCEGIFKFQLTFKYDNESDYITEYWKFNFVSVSKTSASYQVLKPESYHLIGYWSGPDREIISPPS